MSARDPFWFVKTTVTTMVVAIVPLRGETTASESDDWPWAAEMGAAKTASSNAVTARADHHDRATCARFTVFLPRPMNLPNADVVSGCEVEDVLGGRAGQWYVGPGRGSRPVGPHRIRCAQPTERGRSGGVWTGGWADRRVPMARNAHWRGP
jgi:hypothetical protein